MKTACCCLTLAMVAEVEVDPIRLPTHQGMKSAKIKGRLGEFDFCNPPTCRHTSAMTQAYGPPITLDLAQKAAAQALAEARAQGWTMAVAIVDTSGHLVYFARMDDTQTGSVNVSMAKARSAALFRRPTKAFQDALAAGGDGLRILGLEGAVPLEGGLPLVVSSTIAGAIGVSGGTSQQDGQCAQAGADAIKS